MAPLGIAAQQARRHLLTAEIAAVLAAVAACSAAHRPMAQPSPIPVTSAGPASSNSSAAPLGRPPPGSSVGSQRQPSEGGYIWAVPAGTLPEATVTGLQHALDASRSLPADVGPGRYVDLRSAQADADRAVLYGVEKSTANGRVVPTEPLLLLAHRSGSSWTLVTTVDPEFCATLSGMPTSLVGDTIKAYFGGC